MLRPFPEKGMLGNDADLKTCGAAMPGKSVPSFSQPLVLCMVLALVPALALAAQDRGLSVVTQEITGKADFDPGRQYAVIIGIDKYKEWPSLKSAAGEAKAVRKVLSERYVIDEFFELYDEAATAANIRRLFMETLPSRIGSRDSLLVFYSGHGQTDSTKTGFWIASDGSKDIFSQNNWIPNAQLRNMIGNLKAQRILILADACFSGDFLNVSRGVLPVIDNAYYRKALQLTARQVLTSGASETVPDESEFGRQVLNLLERNDTLLLDPMSMYERIRLGVSQTMPLLGTLPGNEDGASFALFLRSATLVARGEDSAGEGQSAAAQADKADLMIKADQEGTEVLVDGVSRGFAPVLVRKLQAGRTLKVVARTATMAASADIILEPGDLRELSLSLQALEGKLYVASNEAAVNLFIDGIDMGPLGSGLFKSLPAGGKKLELKGKDLYWTAMTNISPNETTEVKAMVHPVGSVVIDAPSDAPIWIEGPDWRIDRVGGGRIANIGAGSISLGAGGAGDYLLVTTVLDLGRGGDLHWVPWKGGQLDLTSIPAGALCQIDGAQWTADNGKMEGIAPGTRQLLFTKPGYRDCAQAATVRLGKSTKVSVVLERLAPAVLLVPDYGIGLFPKSDAGSEITAIRPQGASTMAWSVPAGIPSRLRFASAYAERIDIPVLETTFTENEQRSLDLASGGILLPWIPDGARVTIGKVPVLELGNEGASRAWSRVLPPGEYLVTVGDRYSGMATVVPGRTVEPADYRSAMSARLGEEVESLLRKMAARQCSTTAGWFGIATGILGAVGTGVVYYLGSEAMLAYHSAVTTLDAEAAWAKVSRYESLFPAAAAIGGAGFGLTLALWPGRPDPGALRHSMDQLETGIEVLGK